MQGCLEPLQRLLDGLAFDPRLDRLWFCGDLVNRGPDSLGVLRLVKRLGAAAVTVLGNHDLHLIASALGGRHNPKDTFTDVLAAPDRDELLAWLRTRPLAHFDRALGVLLVHAGLPAAWSVQDALTHAREAEACLQDATGDEFLRHHMYGNRPTHWSDTLQGVERLRFAVNAFTRLRYLHPDGGLEFEAKGAPGRHPGLTPWFLAEDRRSAGTRVVFGHWSTLGRVHWPQANVYGLDTGCVWGGNLTALCLETGVLRSVRGVAQDLSSRSTGQRS